MSQKRSSYVKRLFRDFAHHPGLLILASIRNYRSSGLNGLATDPDRTCG